MNYLQSLANRSIRREAAVVVDLKTERRSLQHRYKELDTEIRKIAEAAYGNEEATRARAITYLTHRLGGTRFVG